EADIDDDLFDWFNVEGEQEGSDTASEPDEFDDYNKRTCNWFYELPNWARCITLLIPGAAILATPAVVALLVVRKEGDKGLFNDVGNGIGGYRLDLSTEILRWSCWLTLCWSVWVIFCERIRSRLEVCIIAFTLNINMKTLFTISPQQYVVALKTFITILIWAILVVVLYGILFNQMGIVTYWETGFHVLVVAMVFAICLFFQKLALQIIAVNFHRIAYADRIKASRRAMRVLDRLRRSIKNRVFTELFVPAEVEAARAKKREEENNGDLSSASPSPESGNPTIVVGEHVVSESEDSGAESPHTKENKRSRRGNPLYWVSRMKLAGSRSSVGRDSFHDVTGSSNGLNQIGEGPGGNADISEINLINLERSSEGAPLVNQDPTASPKDPPPRQSSVKKEAQSTPSLSEPINRQSTRISLAIPPTNQSTLQRPPNILSRQSTTRHAKFHLLPHPISTGPSRISVTNRQLSATIITPEAILDAAMEASPSPTSPHDDKHDKHDKIKPTLNVLKDMEGRKYQKEIERLDITSQMHAGKLAKKLFSSLGGRVKGYLTIEDFEPYFPSYESASAAFAIFDIDGNGSLTRRELKDSVIHMYKDRRGLFRALRDLSQAVGKLNRVFFIVSGVVTFCVALPVFGVPLSAMLPFTSFVLALSFVFGGAAKQTFESLLFLFVTHPYDAEFHTPEYKIRALRQKMLEFVQSESREFQPTCDIHINGIEELNKMNCTVSLKHKGNWQDGSKRMNRRTRFFFALKRNIEELGITYTRPASFPYPPPAYPEQKKTDLEEEEDGLDSGGIL
ncbi:hypothetical protein HK097_008066, partial [Rhizophlyctis rosea]